MAILLGSPRIEHALAQPQHIVLRFDPAPLAAPAIYKSFTRPVAGDAGGKAVAYQSRVRSLSRGGTNGIFSADSTGSDMQEALRGQTVAPDLVFGTFFRPSLANNGDVVWTSRLRRFGYGLFRTGLVLIARTGDAVPALSSGVIDRIGLPIALGASDVVFFATIDGGPVVGTATVDEGIFRCEGGDGNCSSGTGGLSALVLVGDPIPDRPSRFICDLFEGVHASGFGLAFKAATRTNCSDAGEPALVGVFRLAFGGIVETVALEGEASNPAGTAYTKFRDVPRINAAGDIAFLADVDGLFRTKAIFRCPFATCPAAAAEVAVSEGDMDTAGRMLSRLGSPGLSDAGDIVFRASARLNKRRPGILVWRQATGVVESLVLKQDPVPTLPAGTLFRRIERPWVSAAGRVVFTARVKAAGGFGGIGIFLIP